MLITDHALTLSEQALLNGLSMPQYNMQNVQVVLLFEHSQVTLVPSVQYLRLPAPLESYR
jgi:hypothetical protein